VALLVIQELKSKAETAYSEMNDWLGAEFLREMDGYENSLLVIIVLEGDGRV